MVVTAYPKSSAGMGVTVLPEYLKQSSYEAYSRPYSAFFLSGCFPRYFREGYVSSPMSCCNAHSTRNYYSFRDKEVKRYVDSFEKIHVDFGAAGMKSKYSESFLDKKSSYLDDFISNLPFYLEMLNSKIDSMKCQNPYAGLITAKIIFQNPYPLCSDIEILSLAVMKLLLRYIYNQKMDRGKLTIGYTMSTPYSYQISYMIGRSIDLKNANGEMQPSVGLYTTLVNFMLIQAENYETSSIQDINIRVYFDGKEDAPLIDLKGLCKLEVDRILLELFQSEDFISARGSPPQVESFIKKRVIQKYITQAEGKKESIHCS